MRFIFRLVGFVFVAAIIAVVGLGVYGYLHRGELVENAIVEATGNESLGAVGHKIANGEELTDDELQDLLGVDTKTLEDVKQAFGKLGIDANSGEELRGVVENNLDKLDDIKHIVERVQAGELTAEQAVDQLSKIVTLP